MSKDYIAKETGTLVRFSIQSLQNYFTFCHNLVRKEDKSLYLLLLEINEIYTIHSK